nr:MAG TPA: hypothetical protein [Caudoviricetes sp.]
MISIAISAYLIFFSFIYSFKKSVFSRKSMFNPFLKKFSFIIPLFLKIIVQYY